MFVKCVGLFKCFPCLPKDSSLDKCRMFQQEWAVISASFLALDCA